MIKQILFFIIFFPFIIPIISYSDTLYMYRDSKGVFHASNCPIDSKFLKGETISFQNKTVNDPININNKIKERERLQNEILIRTLEKERLEQLYKSSTQKAEEYNAAAEKARKAVESGRQFLKDNNL